MKPTDIKLEYYGGQGYGYSKEDGKFEVKAKEVKLFSKLSEAKKYYESLNEEKAIWDVTTIPELLEYHSLLCDLSRYIYKPKMKICPDCLGNDEILSSCCGARIDEDYLICSDCLDHSDVAVCETCDGEWEVEDKK